ncbi:MAG TPA: fluoride efflux transporter CrcB [Candidatus Binatia bacterium]|nr:fluoride efflux transporter CrcB [Candidatus Binatia bacterium]
MIAWLAVAAGGATGSMTRYGVGLLLARVTGFPWATLAVNVTGAFAAGLLYAVWLSRAAPEWRALLLVGFLGGFTTFSAFSLETLLLLQQGQPARALANVALNVALCLLACGAGLSLGRTLAA